MEKKKDTKTHKQTTPLPWTGKTCKTFPRKGRKEELSKQGGKQEGLVVN